MLFPATVTGYYYTTILFLTMKAICAFYMKAVLATRIIIVLKSCLARLCYKEDGCLKPVLCLFNLKSHWQRKKDNRWKFIGFARVRGKGYVCGSGLWMWNYGLRISDVMGQHFMYVPISVRIWGWPWTCFFDLWVFFYFFRCFQTKHWSLDRGVLYSFAYVGLDWILPFHFVSNQFNSISTYSVFYFHSLLLFCETLECCHLWFALFLQRFL